ncbi:MAG: FMN-binding protein [Enterocloster sp.]
MNTKAFMKDAVILFFITLISGCLLGAVYQVTKAPIEQATIAANNKAYKAVFAEAESFEEDDALAAAIESCNADLAGMSYGGVAVENVLKATDASGSQLGYVITSVSNDSYGGLIRISVGLKDDGSITGIEFLETSDTPGLGLKAKEPAFKDQYIGKKGPELSVIKSGNAGENDIVAISGATISSNATTNAVNAALYCLNSCINK